MDRPVDLIRDPIRVTPPIGDRLHPAMVSELSANPTPSFQPSASAFSLSFGWLTPVRLSLGWSWGCQLELKA